MSDKEAAVTNESGKRSLSNTTDTVAKRRFVGKKSPNQDKPEEGAPMQREMPTSYKYERAKIDQLKIVSWNICSLNSSPDIICLQETKLQKAPITLAAAGLDKLKHEYKYFACSTVQKGYAGTAVLSNIKPESVVYGLVDTDEAQCTEGRTITLEFKHFYLVACYVPNAGAQLVRLDRRQKWDKMMLRYLRQLETKKPVVWCGDLNVCHNEIDLARPDSNHRSAGFTDEERIGFSNILGVDPPSDISAAAIAKYKESANDDLTSETATKPAEFIDTWRHLHPDSRRYSYFSFRFGCRPKYLGWRLDYFITSKTLLPRVLASEIRDEVYGASDHVPIMLLLDTKGWSMPLERLEPPDEPPKPTKFQTKLSLATPEQRANMVQAFLRRQADRVRQ
ncbi:Endonuclease/exonuclease/phosphatase [Syncephalis fuscata]|nr:Endonuclease/exonuclease/phosphatase [Syncephalis fuscata]